jgi:hypothetical protein
MKWLALILLAFAVFFFGMALLSYLRTRQSLKKREASAGLSGNAAPFDSGDDTLWNLGKLRPIIDLPLDDTRFARRAFFQKSVRGTLLAYASWVVMKVASVALADGSASASGAAKSEPAGAKDREIAQNSHGDNHHDSHDDSDHSDNSSHIDDHGDSGRREDHYDNHSDRNPHSDYHNDNGHSDYHGDGSLYSAKS